MPYINRSKGTIYGTPAWISKKYLPSKYLDVAPYPWDKTVWNGLTHAWSSTQVNYCNPPFGDLSKGWSQKVKKEAEFGKRICLMMPIRSGSKYTRSDLLPFCCHLVLLPKIKFIDHEDVCNVKGVCPTAVCLMYFNYKPENLTSLNCTLSL